METAFFSLLFILYLAVLGIGGWAVLHAGKRQEWRMKLQAVSARMLNVPSRIGKYANAASPYRLIPLFKQCGMFLAVRKRMAMASLFLLAAPLLMALLLLRDNGLEGYDDTPKTSDPVVLALLRGEQLVPPPALPPAYFVTKEVEAQRQDLGGASREWMKLDADFRQRLLTVYAMMARRGYQVTLLEGYRSPERQAMLAKLGSHVTNAGAYQSYHQYGLAADSAFLRDGKILISEKDPWTMEAYRQYGELAESVGLVWGGRWKMMDFGHVELRRANVLGHAPSRQ